MKEDIVKDGLITGDEKTGTVWINGTELSPEKSLKVRNHSPSGFAWGYGGSGPAQLALAILLEFVDEETAELLYQEFKRAFIAPAADQLKINVENVKTWICQQKLGELLDMHEGA